MRLRKHTQLKRSVDDHQPITADIVSKKVIGKGLYGEVREVDNVVVAKYTKFNNDVCGDPNDPNRPEHIEHRIMHDFHRKFSHQTPHIVAPCGDRTVQGRTVVFLMERAQGKDLRAYLSEIESQEERDLCIWVALFQVCYTLHVIHQVYPSFVHNDLHDQNVLIAEGRGTGVSHYQIGRQSFFVPNIVSVRIADFDFATICGYGYDNYKTVQNVIHMPSWGFSTQADGGVRDVSTLCSFLGVHIKGGDLNVRHLLLRSDVFSSRFSTPGEDRITHKWRLDTTMRFASPVFELKHENACPLTWRGKEGGEDHISQVDILKFGTICKKKKLPPVPSTVICSATNFVRMIAHVQPRWYKWALVCAYVDWLKNIEVESLTVHEWAEAYKEQDSALSLVHFYIQWNWKK